ncbi:MAG: hypothetical protein FHOMOCKG_00016 [Methanophagales virus GBV302]|uniref:Uncharacterized protein n=1 Tax=Methanophagales virus GBV302 TaxID=2999281 RepID=A0A9E8V9E2_9CAUD|nr:MAG: hypothetical protein QIT37_gp016 [Methanophagales virus GBV302]WAE39544.1 MAG: hypothetical protein FHOMOCKG_00016 [Methanophagales virus GBV302]
MKTLERLKVIWKNEREYLDDVIAIFKRVLVTLAFITFLFTVLSITAILMFEI